MKQKNLLEILCQRFYVLPPPKKKKYIYIYIKTYEVANAQKVYVPSILTTKQAPGVSPMSPTLQDASQRSDLRLRLPRLLSHGRGGLVAVADREWCGRALVLRGDEDEDDDEDD